MRSGDDPAIPARIDRAESGPDLYSQQQEPCQAPAPRFMPFRRVLAKIKPAHFAAFAQRCIGRMRPSRCALQALLRMRKIEPGIGFASS
jgi:hypothetical protein